MARLPGVKYLQAGPMAPLMDASAGVAAGRATENIGEAISDVGQHGFQYAEKWRKMDDAGKSSAFMANLDQEASEFENSLITRQDPGNWGQEWQSKVASMKQQLETQDLSREGRARLEMQFNEWSGRRSQDLTKTVLLKGIEVSKGRISNALNYSSARGDQAGWDRAMGDMRESGYYSAPEIERVQMEGERRFAEFDIKESITTDPFSALQLLESPDYIANNPGATKELQIWGQAKAKEAIRQNQSVAVRDLATQIETGEIKTEDQLNEAIKKRGPGVDETTADKLRFNFSQTQAVSPDVKFGVVDNLNRLYDNYTKGEISPEEYRVAHGLVAQRVDEFGARPGVGALRSQVDKMDPASWDGRKLKQSAQEERMRSVSKLGETFERQGAFGEITEDEKTSLTPYERSVKQTQIYEDRERVQSAMETWLSKEENQNADNEQIAEQFRKTYMSVASARILRPGGAWATQPEVGDYIQSVTGPQGAEGDRVTSYGYQGDTTPDSNSSAGIGAWVSRDEQERIKNGEMTPNRLRDGDLAVSRDVEARFRKMGLKPGDQVTIKLDDGTAQTGRWMDRTAESYNGKRLTGRFDVYSPNGPNPLNGKKVVDWWKYGDEDVINPRGMYVPVPTESTGIKGVIDATNVPVQGKKPKLNDGKFSEYNVILDGDNP